MSDSILFNESQDAVDSTKHFESKRQDAIKNLNFTKSILLMDFQKSKIVEFLTEDQLILVLNEILSQGYRSYYISKEKIEEIIKKELSHEDYSFVLVASEAYLSMVWDNILHLSKEKSFSYSNVTDAVLEKISKERKFQDTLWNREPGNWNENNLVKLSVLGEEYGEVCKSLL